MRTSRQLDELSQLLARQGEAAFQLGSSGHEAMATLAASLTAQDWLHPHYRDMALLLARGVSPVRFLHALLATDESDSCGRRMPPFVCERALNIMSTPTLVGNAALQAVGVAAAVRNRSGQPVVYCGLGDGGAQQGEVLEAISEAVREQLPVLFVVEDNRYALSTPTAGRTFYSLPSGDAPDFLGVPIIRVDGGVPAETYRMFSTVIGAMRMDRQPRIAVVQVERLISHSNSDDQTVYRDAAEIAAASARDPLVRMTEWLRQAGVPDDQIATVDRAVDEELQQALHAARAAGTPSNGPAKRPLPPEWAEDATENRNVETNGLTMIEAMRRVLGERLDADDRVSLAGQDIRDPKGDVFGLTRGLSSRFPDRVFNAPLSESTIVGTAIGRALAGERPVAFLQFADFFPLAYNQLFSELGSLYWRTNGAWEAPVVVMAITGGYRAGLGPYHAQSPEAVMCHIPGVDVYMPSNAADAAGLLNAALQSGRPSVFFYPKNLLNDRQALASPETATARVPIGCARTARAGNDLTLVAWGNTVSLCEQAAEVLASAGVQAEVIDLRTLSPWDRRTVCASATRTGRLLVTHEDMRTCGLGAEIVAEVVETCGAKVQAARVTTPDTYLPFHHGNMQALLPSFHTILEKAAALCDVALRWESIETASADGQILSAIGSSPSDETIKIMTLHVREGDALQEGQLFASAEAEKAAFEIASPFSGTVERIRVEEGDEVRVGAPLADVRVVTSSRKPQAATMRPVVERCPPAPLPCPASHSRSDAAPVSLVAIASALGSRKMTNEDILSSFPHWSSEDVVQRTGIETRYWLGEQESALTLGVQACRKLLEQERLALTDIDALVCSTGTPPAMTPSLACRILEHLSPPQGEVMMQAMDVNAACSGYLYALQTAFDICAQKPGARVLVVTAETLSPLLDPHDPVTLFLFGDAATASLVQSGDVATAPLARVRRPVCSAKGEPPEILSVPFPGQGEYIRMEGQQVFRVAVRKMVDMLQWACADAGLAVHALDVIVPHQANARIMDAIRQKIRVPPERMFNHIRHYGNTSSNTIPLALQDALPVQAPGAHIGLCAFGGGFTFAAGILDRPTK